MISGSPTAEMRPVQISQIVSGMVVYAGLDDPQPGNGTSWAGALYAADMDTSPGDAMMRT
jgi:hypothetical protein